MGISNYTPSSRISQSGVCTSTTRPASPFEGQVIYESDTDRVLVWNASAWVAPNSQTSNPPGLEFIAETSFTASANPFINGCFSSSYQNYLVKVNVTASASADVFYRFRSGVNTPETGNVYDRYGFYYAGSIVSMISANLVGAYATDATSGNTRGVADINLFSPNEAIHTMGTGHAWGGSSGAMYTISNRIETTTQYTGIELTTFAATTLTGTMRVYGYRN